MFRLPCLCLAACLLAGATLWAADPPAKVAFFPLKDIKPGMKAVGRTVFNGSTVEEFQAEILGVLPNIAPRQSVILVRLSGGPLEKTGVMAGMSGSPIYIDGKLVGAVALSFAFSKEPIAGVTPIEQMAEVLEKGAPVPAPPALKVELRSIPTLEGSEPRLAALPASLLPAAADEGLLLWPGQPRMMQIATPLVLSGFTSRALEQFAPQLRALGMVPMQGGGGSPSLDDVAAQPSASEAKDLVPGSMISVQLIRGDLGVNADGTVTYRDGDRIYAFGHRFLASGPTEMPFAASRVITLLPNTASSFKISVPGALLGAIRQDRASGVLGVIGERPQMIPVGIRVESSRSKEMKYRFEIVNDRYLSPFLLQMAVFGCIDATERLLGESSLAVRGAVSLTGLPPVRIENLFSADANAPMLAAQTTAAPLLLLLQSGFPGVNIKSIDLEIISTDERHVLTLDQVWSSKREAQPGEKIEITAVLRGDNGQETVKKYPLEIPSSLGPGPLQITVADGNSLNLGETRELAGGYPPRSPAELVTAINKLRKNNRLYVRLSRPQTAFLLHGVQFPSPPPSLVRAMAGEAFVSTNIATSQQSTLAETETEALPAVVAGQKTITVTVKY